MLVTEAAIDEKISSERKKKFQIMRKNILVNDKNYPISPIGIAAQELILIGGLENWVKKQIQ